MFIKILIVATSATPRDITQEIASSSHHRIDYLSLASAVKGTYVDYHAVNGGSRILQWIENKTRLDLRLARCVSRIAADGDYDIVLSLSERVGIPLARMLPRTMRHVVIMHHPMSSKKLRLLRILRIGDRLSRIITISEAEARGLESALNLPAGSVKAIRTPVDPHFFDPQHEESVSVCDQDHIQSLGLSHRDYSTLIRAMRQLPEIRCHLRVGSTWVSRQSGHEDEALPNNVQVKAYVHPAVLRTKYLKSRFIVVPIQDSTQWSAGCTTVQQAQAMGKAVIATARPGLVDYLVDGETGILVPPGNESALAEAIRYLWEHPQVSEDMGRKGRAHQVKHYSLDHWLDSMHRVFREVMLDPNA